jgi:hypothetical protein
VPTALDLSSADPRKTPTSWAVFVVCSPTWLSAQGPDDLLLVYNAFLGLATSVDKKTDPAWPFRDSPARRAENVGLTKSQPYCDSLRLNPATGPFVVIVTTQPDQLTPKDGKVVLSLGGGGALEIANTMLRLTELLIEEPGAEAQLGSVEWWVGWEKMSTWMRGRFRGASMSVQRPGQRER